MDFGSVFTRLLQLGGSFRTTLTANPTANRTIALPDKDGSIALADDVAVSSHPGLLTGNYYLPAGLVTPANVGFSANVLHFLPFYVPRSTAFDRIAIRVTTASAAGGRARLGIYSLANSRPIALIADAGEVAIDSTGIKDAALNGSLSAGWVALCVNFSVGSSQVASVGQLVDSPYLIGDNTLFSIPGGNLRVNSTYGAMPASAPATGYSVVNSAPIIALRAA